MMSGAVGLGSAPMAEQPPLLGAPVADSSVTCVQI